jgi:hypothetical protein
LNVRQSGGLYGIDYELLLRLNYKL